MADITHTTTKPHLLAIDIARRFNAVFIELASGEQRRFKMTNSAQDFEAACRAACVSTRQSETPKKGENNTTNNTPAPDRNRHRPHLQCCVVWGGGRGASR